MPRYSCNLCGDVVRDCPIAITGGSLDVRPSKSWTAEFRMISPTPNVHNPTVSGVGCYRRGEYFCPADFNARWDDEGYQFPDSDKVDEVQVLLHSHCYSLLEKFFHPQPVPTSRILTVFNALPRRRIQGLNNLIWGPGHDFGGLVKLKKQYPWGEAVRYVAHEPVRFVHCKDPWTIPELMTCLQESPLGSIQRKGKRRRTTPVFNLWTATLTNKALMALGDGVPNVFTELPLEILELILTYTRTDGVESLSLSSKELKKIIPSRLSQAFWESRFQPGLDFAWAFEAWEHGAPLNWRSLYSALNRSSDSALSNRRRIWILIESLSELLRLKWNGNDTLLPLQEDEDELDWKTVHGMIRLQESCDYNTPLKGTQGCMQHYSKVTLIPTLLSRVGVSIVKIGDVTYVTGLHFSPENGPEIYLGYTNGREQTLSTTGIRGFITAVGSRGIHALQFISPEGELSEWFGDPKGGLKTRRLATHRPITVLRSGFDSFKMVSIAVQDLCAGQGPRDDQALRDNALWFPDIPPANLHLNTAYFKPCIDFNPFEGFVPLCATFGNPKYPRSPSKISIMADINAVKTIECHYGVGVLQKLGLQDSSYFKDTASLSVESMAGEKFDTITLTRMPRTGFQLYVDIDDGPSPGRYYKHEMETIPPVIMPMQVVAGTRLVGLYAIWGNRCMASIGPISQFIERTDSVL